MNASFDGLFDRGATAWPGVRLERDVLGRHLTRLFPDGCTEELFARLNAEHLFLACAAGHGDAAAFVAIEEQFLVPLRATLARLKLSAPEDVEQAVRMRLFLFDRKILAYDGRGSLRSWLRVVLVREALDTKRKRSEGGHVDVSDALAAADDDPELSYLKAQYRKEFAAAVADAAADLSPRQRNILKQQLVFGLGIDEIGRMYRVHRATAARWLKDARDALAQGTRRHLASRVRASEASMESILRLVVEDLEMSARRLLESTA